MKRRDFFKHTCAAALIGSGLGFVSKLFKRKPKPKIYIIDSSMVVTNKSSTHKITLPGTNNSIVLEPNESVTIDHDGDTWRVIE